MADDTPDAQSAAVEAALAPAPGEGSPFATLEPEIAGAGTVLVEAPDDAAAGDRLGLVLDVPVCVSIELGRTNVAIRDVVNLGRGSIIELDRGPGAPLDVRVNGVLIGRGEVVLVDSDRLGLRFVEVVSQPVGPKRFG